MTSCGYYLDKNLRRVEILDVKGIVIPFRHVPDEGNVFVGDAGCVDVRNGLRVHPVLTFKWSKMQTKIMSQQNCESIPTNESFDSQKNITVILSMNNPLFLTNVRMNRLKKYWGKKDTVLIDQI